MLKPIENIQVFSSFTSKCIWLMDVVTLTLAKVAFVNVTIADYPPF